MNTLHINLPVVIVTLAEAYFEPSETSKIDFFYENS